MNKIKIGWAEIDITPEKKVSLIGQFSERISEFVEKPLTATALALESDGKVAVFCSCDLVGTDWALLDAVRKRLCEKNAPFDVNSVIINATHVHTAGYSSMYRNAPEGQGLFENYRKTILEYLAPNQKYVDNSKTEKREDVATPKEIFDILVDRISKVILLAYERRKEGSFVNAFGRAPVGMCRRSAFSDGTAQMWGDTNTEKFTQLEGGSDTGIELLYFFDEDKKLTGIVANLACPAQCVQHRHFVSPDFWGEAKMLLRKRFGENIFLLPQCSAAGDQCPVDLVRFVEPESDLDDPNCIRINPPKRKADPSMFDLSGMKLTGRRIANEIIMVYEDGLDDPVLSAAFEHKIIKMPLPLRRATDDDVKNAKEGIRSYMAAKEGDVDFNDIAMVMIHLGVLDREKLQKEVEFIEEEIHIIRLGDISFATNPFELFLNYGNQIKARSKSEQTFIVQLANGAEGYLPTKIAELHGHYSGFISSGLIGHEGGEILVEKTLSQIADLFE